MLSSVPETILICVLMPCVLLLQVKAHLSDSCPSVVNGRDIFTRSGTNYGDFMYFWTATYPHGGVQGSGLQQYGSGCYSKSYRKLYFRTSTTSFPTCNSGDGDGTAPWFASGSKVTWATGLTNHNADIPGARPHCNTNINFQKKWHFVGEGFRLPGPNNANSDNPLYVSMCFSGFMCEAIQVTYNYRVYSGCNRGFYEDTSITWQKNTPGGVANPEYCVMCPPGQYQDQRNQLKGSPNVCKICPAGKFGDESLYPERDVSAYCQNCPAGRYGSTTGSIDPLCQGPCTAGFYCPSNVINTRPTGGVSGANLLIAAGFFGGAGSATAQGSSECPAGYFCPQGTADVVCAPSGTPNNCRKRCGYGLSNPEAYYCPARSSSRTAVPPGYYAAGIGDPDHEEETRDQQKVCKPPNYCPGGGTVGSGKEIPCPAGKFGASEALSDPACDGSCAPGFFCTKGSDQNDENRCGREQTYPAAFYCPPGSSTRTAVSSGKYTFCCAVQNANCPQNQRIACSEDQRHYQGDCPAGFTCQNGAPVTIKWRDNGNVGQCFANDINKPNIGQSTGDVEEGSTGALFHLSGQVTRTVGITATDAGANTVTMVMTDYSNGLVVYFTKTEGTNGCSGLVSGTFYKIKNPQSAKTSLETMAGALVNIGAAETPATNSWNGAATCGNLQLWGSSNYGIRALDGQEQPITTASDYTVKSQSCLDPIGPASGDWTTMFVASTNDVYLKTTKPLVYSGTGACKKYRVVLKAVAGNANGECTTDIDVKNANDPPAWNSGMVFDLAIDEGSIAGAPVKFQCDAFSNSGNQCDLLGTVAPNANFDLVTDPDAGQDVFFEVVKPTSNGGEYPTNTGSNMLTDAIFGVSRCTGEIFVAEAANTLLKFTDVKKYDLCVTACDDPAFFGLPDDQKKCAAPPSNANTNCGVTCPSGSVCYRIYVTDVNDPPKWYTDESTKCQKDWANEECVADCCAMVNEKTQGDLALFSISPQRGRPSDSEYPAWTDDNQLDRSIRDLVYDPDGDDLTYSVVCQNCPGARQDLFQVVKNSGNNKFQIKVNNPLSSSGELAYGASPSYSLVITVADDEFKDEMTMQIFIADVNESPVFPAGITFSEYENCCSNPTTCPSSPDSDDRTFNSNDFTATDPEGPNTVITYTTTSSVDSLGTEYNLVPFQKSGNTYTLQTPNCLDYEAAGTSKTITVTLSVADNKYTRTCECATCSDIMKYCTTPSSSVTGTITVNILNINEAFTVASTVSKTTLELVDQGEEVLRNNTGNNQGAPYSISDPDVGQTYTFAFNAATTANTKALFNLDSSNGKITTKVGPCSESGTAWPCLDYFNDATAQVDPAKWLTSYAIHVDVTDSMEPKKTATTVVTVTVANSNEKPFVIQVNDDHMSHTHPLAIDEDNTAWTQQLRALDRDARGSEVVAAGTSVPQGSYSVITTTPGSWSLNENSTKYVDEGTNVETIQFSLSSTGTMAVAGSAVLDFEKAQSYNVEVTYTDAGGLESERRVMYVQLYDVNEAPVLVANIAMDETSENNWYAISQHKQWTLSDCNNGQSDQEHHYCYTGQCVENGLAVSGDYCNVDSHCSGSATCEPKVIKNNAFTATDVDTGTVLQYRIVQVSTTTDTIGSTPTWTTTDSTILNINSQNGALRTTIVDAGLLGTSPLVDLDTKYKVQVEVTDEDGSTGNATGGDATFKAAAAGKWLKKTSATVTVYFKTIQTNTFPVFAPSTTLQLNIREDAADGFILDTAIGASDADTGDLLNWDTGTLANGQKNDPTMSDNSGAGIATSLRGDKFKMKLTTGTSNYLKLVGDGIDYERLLWTTKPKVAVQVSIDDGKGGTALRNIEVTVIDVNEPPSWKQPGNPSGFSITVDEKDPITSTTFSPETGELTNFDATDVDYQDNLTYTVNSTMAGSEPKDGVFSIHPTTRVITLAQALNYEEITSYTLTVRVTDSGSHLGRVGSTLWSHTTVQVVVRDNNEQPRMTAASMTKAEDQSNFIFRFDLQTLTTDDDEGRTKFNWTKTSETPATLDMFEVGASTGLLKLRDQYLTLDFENAENHTIAVSVTDGWKNIYKTASAQQQAAMVDSPDLTASATYTITVTDVNDIGVPALNNTNYLFQTTGGDIVELNAQNLGPTDFKCPGSTCTSSDVTYKVTYGPPTDVGVALAYTATGCQRVSGHDNAKLRCTTVAGVGTGHVWEIAVTYGSKTTFSKRSITTSSYNRPTLSTVGVSSKSMPTVGKVTLTFNGNDLGPVNSPAEVFYVSNAGAATGGTTKYMKYPASACSVTVASTTVECTASPGVGKDIKYCLSAGGQYSEAWCSNYEEGDTPPSHVLHSIEGGTGTTRVSITKQNITAAQGLGVTQGTKSGTLTTSLSGTSNSMEVVITTGANVYFDTLADIQIATTPPTTIVAANLNYVNNGATSTYAIPTITRLEGKPYDKILTSLDGATNIGGIKRINAIMEVSLLEPMLTQDIFITASATTMSGSFKISYDGETSGSCLDINTVTNADIENQIIEVLAASGVSNANNKVSSVTGAESITGTGSAVSKWIKISLDRSFTKAKEITVTVAGCSSVQGAALTTNTASWGADPWGTNGESGVYFTLKIPSGCDYCKDRDQATTGKIYPGKTSGPHSLQHELEALPGIGAGMLTVVRTASTVGEGYVWTITFSGSTVMGNIPAMTIDHNIETVDIIPRSSTNRHRVESPPSSIGSEQKLSVNLVTTGRMGGLRARGGDMFEAVGTDFGPRGTAVFLYYGPTTEATRYTATQCDVIIDHVRMKCVSSSGVGTDHVSFVKVGGQLSSTEFSSDKLFYRPPSVVSVGGSGAIGSTTAGGASIIITGSDFGPRFTSFTQPCTFETDPVSTQPETALVAANVAVHYGNAPNTSVISGVNYGAECCVVQSDERMVCRTTQGTGFNHAWTIRVGGQWSTVNKAGTSYGQPIIISYENFPSQIIPDVNDYNTTGGEPIVILGKNLGHLLWKIETASYGMLSDGEFNLDTSSCVIQKPHTELRCYMAPGAGLQMTWRVVVDGQSSVYPTSAYAPPQVHGFSIDTTSVLQSTTSELNSHGGQAIIIHGQNFGPSDTFITKVTYGPYGTNYVAKNCTIKVASTQILCVTAPGIGQNHRWIVSIRSQTNSLQPNEPRTSYRLPEITSISPSEGETNGGTEITISGYHFGAVDIDSNPGVAVYLGTFSGQMLGCKNYQVQRGRNNPALPNPNTMNNLETISFILPEFHTANHPVKVVVGAGTCPPEACASCPSLLRSESNPATDGSVFSYKPPKISLIQIRSFENATGKDKMLILEGTNFCEDEVCGAVWMGDLAGTDGVESPRILTRNGQERLMKTPCPQYSGPNAPQCQYSHNKIVLVTNAETGTIWITAGKNSTTEPSRPQETNVASRPPKQFQFRSPEISEQNKTDLNSLTFDTEGGCLIHISGRYFGPETDEDKLCVTVGKCIPRPETCGDTCNSTNGEIVGQSVKVTAGSLRFRESDQSGSFSFTVPPGQGSFNDFFVWRADQASINDFVSPHSTLREYALNYKRVGDPVTESEKSCDSDQFLLPDSQVGVPTNGNCINYAGSCKKTTSSGDFCITPSCYNTESVPVLTLVATGAKLVTVPSTGAYINIESTQLGEVIGNTGKAPPNSKILFGAYYQEVESGQGGEGCLAVGCDWLLSENQNQPKCGCNYPSLSPNEPDLWDAADPENRSKTWTERKITNVYIPEGTGKGYTLQVLVNGVPSAPIQINYAAPEITSITDFEGNSEPAFAGTAGGTLLTIKGTNFGCNPTAGTIDPNNNVPDGLLTPDELLKIYDNDLRTVDDILSDYDTSYDESIRFPTDLNKQRTDRIKAANGISRKEFDAWERRDRTTAPFLGTKQALNLCQGPPIIQLNSGGDSFPCFVVSLTHTSLTCNTTAGEGKELDVSLFPAGSEWTIGNIKGKATPTSLVGEKNTKINSFSYKIPQVFAIETTIPGTDCIGEFGHACGPSSARVRVAVAIESHNASASNNRRRLVGNVPSNNGTVTEPVLVTIRGSNFGRSNGAPIEVKMLCQDGAKHCTGQELTLDPSTVVRSQEKITIQLSPGLGENLAVQIKIAGQMNIINGAGRFSYLAPKITAVYPDYGKTLEFVTRQDREDGKFFVRRFLEGDNTPNNGVLSLDELRNLLSASQALREIVDLTARDAEFTFDSLDFDRSGNLTQEEFISITYSPTDGCETGSFESLSQWQDRVTQATKAQKDANPKQYERMCLKPRTMIYFGENLGPLLTNEKLPSQTRIWLGACASFGSSETCNAMERCKWNSGDDVCIVSDPDYKGAFDVYDARTQTKDSKCAELSSYDETEQSWFVTCSPVGLGVDHTIFVSIAGRELVSSTTWSFAKPSITSSTPRPYNANGEEIVIRGANLGGVFSPTQVNISDNSCLDAQWMASHDTDGLPYVRCRSQRGIVGSKTVTMNVAMQVSAPAKAFPNVANVTTQLSRFHTVCKNGETNKDTGEITQYYGSPGQLCALCPTGAICQSESYAQPASKAGFWKDELDLTEGDETAISQTEPLIKDDRMSTRALDDMKRALGEMAGSTEVRRPACAAERMLRIFSNNNDNQIEQIPREDQLKNRLQAENIYTEAGRSLLGVQDTIDLSRHLANGYPTADRTDRCSNFVACQPNDACKSGNTCSEAYLHTLPRCEKWQNENPTMNSCNLTIQCVARQSGSQCMGAISQLCRCPKQWEVGSFDCAKKCVRDQKDDLAKAGCDVTQLAAALARLPPLSTEFMNGATCIRNANSSSGEGQCSCVSAPRCSLCTAGLFYRVSGECIPCPQNPELIIIGAILGIIFMCIGMRELDKRKFNLAFVSIGWDYFQVLALFAGADIKWPPLLKNIFRMLSFFNINIDIVAPECLVPDLPYSDKYFATMLMPIGVALLLFLSWLANIFFDKCIQNRKVSSSAAKIMGGKLISSFLLGMYFMYLMITQRAFEIFNCNPVEPDDGFTYTHFTSIDCDGGLCRCWDPNHVQAKLVPFSILAILIVTLGFPILIFTILRRKKNAIKEDQYLRALDIVPIESTNPVAFYNRLKYHKMYYHFKPGKVYWITFIIARKGMVSTAGLLFRANPGFQLAFVCLVLFWAYVEQVKNQPFMSSVERTKVILEHQAKVKMGDQLHVTLASRIQAAREEEDKAASKRRRKERGGKTFESVLQKSANRTKKDATKMNYFWNYNTVERVLLSCLIIVCVCGVMFESDRFQENNNRPAGNGFGAWVRVQQEFVTWLCILVIFGSMFFYFAVAYSEIFGRLPYWVKKVMCIKTKINLHDKADLNHRGSEPTMIFQQNPHMLAERDRLAAEAATADIKDQLAAQQEVMRREKLRAAAAIAQAQGKNKTKRSRGKKKKRAKKGFGAVKTAYGNTTQDGKEIELSLVAASKSDEKGSEAGAPANNPKVWKKHKSLEGKTYYSNDKNETVWTLPQDGVAVDL